MSLRVLLDTHAFIWWHMDHRDLSVAAGEAIAESANEIYISAASAWEITTKYRIGKAPQLADIAADVVLAIARPGFIELPVTVAHGQASGSLPGPHKDPFDRMLIAQALTENMVLVSNETLFDAFGVQRLW